MSGKNGDQTMNFNDILYARRQEKVFLPDEVIPSDVLDDILYHFHATIPSKQGEYPYYVDVLDWSDEELRHDLYWHSFNEDDDRQVSAKNPQTLAPILMCLTIDKRDEVFGHIEVGIAAMHLAYAITDAGWESGFCGCVIRPDEVAEKLGYTKENHITQLMIGVGKHNPSGRYICPISGTEKKTGPNRDEKIVPFDVLVKKRY